MSLFKLVGKLDPSEKCKRTKRQTTQSERKGRCGLQMEKPRHVTLVLAQTRTSDNEDHDYPSL